MPAKYGGMCREYRCHVDILLLDEDHTNRGEPFMEMKDASKAGIQFGQLRKKSKSTPFAQTVAHDIQNLEMT